MSGEKIKTVVLSLPPPIGGINAKDPQLFLPPTDASFVKNYYPFSSSLRAVSEIQVEAQQSANNTFAAMHNWLNASSQERVILTSNSSINAYDSNFSGTLITGAVTITNGLTYSQAFNDYLFLVNGTDNVIRVNRSLTTSNAAFTNIADDDVLTQVWSYNNRLYFVEKDSNVFWYGGVEAVTGDLESFDLSTIFDVPSELAFGASWSFNQGIQNEELCIFVSFAGEILIYSGDSPESPNWFLIGRAKTGDMLNRRSFIKLGGDIIFQTTVGAVKLSGLLASTATTSEFVLSDKMNQAFQIYKGDAAAFASASTTSLCLDAQDPFIYIFTPGTLDVEIYVFNYQTGAWSGIAGRSLGDIKAISTAFGQLLILHTINTNSLISSTSVSTVPIGEYPRVYSTGWLDLGTRETKIIRRVCLYTGYFSKFTASDTDYFVQIEKDFEQASAATTETFRITDAQYDANTTKNPFELQFAPGSVGKWFRFTVGVNNTVNGGGVIDELYGLEIQFEYGGMY